MAHSCIFFSVSFNGSFLLFYFKNGIDIATVFGGSVMTAITGKRLVLRELG